MARKTRSGGGGPGSGDWLNTYADMVTLLLTFFILLFSMSSLDSARYNMLVKVFASDKDSSDKIVIRGEATGQEQTGSMHLEGDPVTEVNTLDDVFKLLQQMVREQGLEDSIQVGKDESSVFIQFMNDMLFEPNSAVLKSAYRDLLKFVGETIRSVQGQVASINIVGHTARIPDNPDYAVSDRLLSTERANAVLMYFEDVIKIEPTKLFATGYGMWKSLPHADNNTEAGRSMNRRVEILISSKSNSLSEQLDNVYEKLVE